MVILLPQMLILQMCTAVLRIGLSQDMIFLFLLFIKKNYFYGIFFLTWEMFEAWKVKVSWRL